MDTIFALASAQGKAGVAVIRISGPLALEAVHQMAGPVPDRRRAALRMLRIGNDILDEALVLTFAQGSSFTGEDVAELQLHGSIATVQAVLRALGEIDGLRPAEPGEFTRRALMNGRLDLAQVEGLGDLIEAETEAQRKQALRVLSGAIGEQAEAWRRDLVRAAALIEATIDFADEDVPVDVTPEVTVLLSRTHRSLSAQLLGFGAAERIRDGFEVAIVGVPNVGKSTLLNALAGREAAITSEFAGTTRDVIEVRMDIRGLPVTLLDTAGLREGADVVESIGIDRAIDRAQKADLRIFLSNGELPEVLEPRAGDLVVRGKADICDGGPGLAISGRTGQGVDRLMDAVHASLLSLTANQATITRERHRQAVASTIGALEMAQNRLSTEAQGAELVAEDLRRATRSLDALVGRVDVEHLLDEIFASFCIGK